GQPALAEFSARGRLRCGGHPGTRGREGRRYQERHPRGTHEVQYGGVPVCRSSGSPSHLVWWASYSRYSGAARGSLWRTGGLELAARPARRCAPARLERARRGLRALVCAELNARWQPASLQGSYGFDEAGTDRCGNVNRKIAPRASAFSAHRRPPCASTIIRESVNPTPRPAGLVVKSGLKILSNWSFGIPCPESRTVTSRLFASAMRASRI